MVVWPTMLLSRPSFSTLHFTLCTLHSALASIADPNIRFERVADEFVFAFFMVADAGVEVEEARSNPDGESCCLAGEEHPLGPIHEFREFHVEFLMLAADAFCFFRQLRGDMERFVKIAVRFFQSEMEGELVAQFAQPIDQVAAHARGDGTGAALPQVSE